MVAVAEVTVEMVVRAGEVALYHAQFLTHVLNDVFDGPGVHHVGILGIRHVNKIATHESARLIDTPAIGVGLLLEAGEAVQHHLLLILPEILTLGIFTIATVLAI